MTTESYKFGVDTILLLGTAPFDVTGQLRAGQVDFKEEVKTLDAIPVADNTEIPAEEEAEYTAALKGKLMQALSAGQVNDWTLAHRGEWQPFVLVPSGATDRAYSGTVRIVPITGGGEVSKPRTRPEADFEWAARGPSGDPGTVPIFGVYNPVGHTVTEDA